MPPPADSDLLASIQSALGSTFTIERELGGGGMSRVFLAEERSLHRQIVIKVLRPELAIGVSADRFSREVLFAARLQQANIVPVITTGDADGLPFYTMPFVAGESLRALLDATPRLPVPQVIDILFDVTRALAYAHEGGIVHRDIKPENILLSGGTAVVTDFGIAKAVSASRTLDGHDTLTNVGVSLGTPAYMSPEQALGESTVDHRADLYALGIVGYEMLAGARPFTSTSLRELVRAHVMETPAPIAARRPDTPPALATVIDQCLAKSPDDRPAGAEALLEALRVARRQSTTTRVVDVEAVSRVTAASRAPMRRAAVFAGAAAVIVLGGAGAYAWRSSRATVADVDVDPARIVIAAPTSADASTRDVAARFAESSARTLSAVSALRGVTSIDDAGDERALLRSARAASAGTAVGGSATARGSDSVELRLRILDTRRDGAIVTLAPIVIARTAGDSAIAAASDLLYSSVVIAAAPSLGPAMLPRRGAPRFAAVREILAADALRASGATADAGSSDAVSQLNLALEHYARARSLDSTYLQARLWQAVYLVDFPVAYFAESRAIGDTVRMEIEPKLDQLSLPERALYDFVIAQHLGRVPAQLDAIRRLRAIAPNVELARTLPTVLLNQYRPREALEVLQTLPPSRDATGTLVPPERDVVRLRQMAEIYHVLGDRRRNIEVANQIRGLLPDDIVAVRGQLIAASWDGDSSRIASLVADARSLPRAPAGSPYGFFGDVVLAAGQELTAHGHPQLGKQLVGEAIAWFESRSPADLDRYVQLRKALAYHAARNETAAWAAVQPLVQSDTASVLYVGLAARLAAARHDTAATQHYVATLVRLGASASGAATQERAFVAAELGQKDEAVRLLRESFAQGIGWNVWWRLHWFNDLELLHGYPPFEALIRPLG